MPSGADGSADGHSGQPCISMRRKAWQAATGGGGDREGETASSSLWPISPERNIIPTWGGETLSQTLNPACPDWAENTKPSWAFFSYG